MIAWVVLDLVRIIHIWRHREPWRFFLYDDWKCTIKLEMLDGKLAETSNYVWRHYWRVLQMRSSLWTWTRPSFFRSQPVFTASAAKLHLRLNPSLPRTGDFQIFPILITSPIKQVLVGQTPVEEHCLILLLCCDMNILLILGVTISIVVIVLRFWVTKFEQMFCSQSCCLIWSLRDHPSLITMNENVYLVVISK